MKSEIYGRYQILGNECLFLLNLVLCSSSLHLLGIPKKTT